MATKVGVCGLGAMGGGMAKHLIKEGFPVIGFDIYQPLVDKLIEAGGKAAATPAETAKEADVLLIMVTSSAQVSSVLFDDTMFGAAAVHQLRTNAAIIVSSTVPPDYCNEVRARLDDLKRPDVYLLDCPVSGGTPRAAEGTLSIFSSGPLDGLQKAHPVLKALSAVLYQIPGGIGFGSKAKMCHQVLPEVEIALAAEAMALAARAGLNTKEVLDAVQASDGSSWINGNRIPHMLEGDKTIYSAIPNSQKDSVREAPPFTNAISLMLRILTIVYYSQYLETCILSRVPHGDCGAGLPGRYARWLGQGRRFYPMAALPSGLSRGYHPPAYSTRAGRRSCCRA